MRILLAAFFTICFSACASHKVSDQETAKSPAPAPAAIAPAPASAGPDAVAHEAAKEAASLKTAVAHAHHAPRGDVPSEKALTWLKNGNHRFVTHHLRKDGDTAKDRARLLAGQKPHTIVLSCSDSRTPPEVLFDQKLGEIFVIRTAGEALDFSAIASIEYGLEHLGSNLIVVMGHESCGAVAATLETMNGSDAGSPWLNSLVHDLQPHLQSFAGKPHSPKNALESWANTEGVAKDLITRSQIVRDAVNSGEVKIQTALYHMDSGVVEFNQAKNQRTH